MKYILDVWKNSYNGNLYENDNIGNNLVINNINYDFINNFENLNYKSTVKMKLPKINEKTKSHFYNIKNIDNKPESIINLFIVPGDIIFLEQGKIVPCDCIILDGYCSVIESYLTGESNHILKEALPKSNYNFSYENTKSILFQGTLINKCESSHSENGINFIKCLVINTGYNTYWGNFLQNILFPKKMNFNFYHELRIFFYIMIFIFLSLLSIILFYLIDDLKCINEIKSNKGNSNLEYCSIEDYEILKKLEKNEVIYVYIIDMIDLLTLIIPPTLQICMNVASLYFNEILKMRDITCLSEKRLNAAGKVNIIVLDKTGTLTSDGLEISGFQTTQVNFDEKENDYLGFDFIKKNLNIYRSMHREFWIRFCTDYKNDFYDDYLVNWKNNPIYFIECLATCLSIDKLRDNNILGNTMDKELFKLVEWDLEKIDEKWNGIPVKDFFILNILFDYLFF